jgi:3'(2'), 5'-bisphosphate nucleotidase
MHPYQPVIDAVRLAAALCQTVQARYLTSLQKTSDGKRESEPVTIADYGAQALIGRALARAFPDDHVIAEETSAQYLQLVTPEGQATIEALLADLLGVAVTQADIVSWLDQGLAGTSARTWIIDPIDGTKGFIEMRHYAIAVGVAIDGAIRDGIMACPAYEGPAVGESGALFYTQDGRAYAEPLAGGPRRAVQVSATQEPARMRVVQSFERRHASRDRMARVRHLAGLDAAHVDDLDSMEKYALVAAGDAEITIRLSHRDSTRRHMSWDHAAGVALVQAAGGRVSDLDGAPLDFSQGRALPNQGMLTSNGPWHDRLVGAAQQVLAEET